MTRFRYPRSINTFNTANIRALALACDPVSPMSGVHGSHLLACIGDEFDAHFRRVLTSLRDKLNKMPSERDEFVQRYLYGLIQR